MLVSPDGRALADEITARTGAVVRTLHRLDVTAARLDTEVVIAAILASPHEQLLVTIGDDGVVQTIPYERRTGTGG